MKIIAVALIFFSLSVYASPHRIIVVRHGEEPPNHMVHASAMLNSGPAFVRGLGATGQRRAAYLVGYFLGIPGKQDPLFSDMTSKDPSVKPVHPITFIGAYSTEDGRGTFRPVETIAPLANVINVDKAPIDVYDYAPATVKQYSADQKSELKQVVDQQEHTVVLCWESNDIPLLISALEPRITGDPTFQKTFPDGHFPPDYPYHLTFVITYDRGSPSFEVYEQEQHP
jgi:hypothetical protein